MLFHHFVYPDLRVEIFFKKEEGTENEGFDFEIGDIGTSVLGGLRKLSCGACTWFSVGFF